MFGLCWRNVSSTTMRCLTWVSQCCLLYLTREARVDSLNSRAFPPGKSWPPVPHPTKALEVSNECRQLYKWTSSSTGARFRVTLNSPRDLSALAFSEEESRGRRGRESAEFH